MRRLVAAIRDNDERKVEKAVLQLAGTRKIFAPLALAVGAFVTLFSGLRLLVTNWRLIPVQMLPAKWIWAMTVHLKAHALRRCVERGIAEEGNLQAALGTLLAVTRGGDVAAARSACRCAAT